MVGYIGLGSNVEPRQANLAAGLAGLDRAGIELVAVSSLWETEPIDAPGPLWFLNMVAKIRTLREPEELLDALLAIEAATGRRRDAHNGPRTLDLDLLLLGQRVVRGERLELPHPRMWSRRFVLEPLAEIEPELLDPATGQSVTVTCRDGGLAGRVERIGRLAHRGDPTL